MWLARIIEMKKLYFQPANSGSFNNYVPIGCIIIIILLCSVWKLAINRSNVQKGCNRLI